MLVLAMKSENMESIVGQNVHCQYTYKEVGGCEVGDRENCLWFHFLMKYQPRLPAESEGWRKRLWIFQERINMKKVLCGLKTCHSKFHSLGLIVIQLGIFQIFEDDYPLHVLHDMSFMNHLFTVVTDFSGNYPMYKFL